MAWVWKGRSGGADGIPLSWGPTGMCTLQPPLLPFHQPWKTLLQMTGSGFSLDWGSHTSWAYCHSWYEPTWASLHHVTKNGRFHVPTRFLWRPRYALHGFAVYYAKKYWRPLPWLPPSTTGADEEPCCIQCKNDGWHCISSTSAEATRCKGICTSCHQRSRGHVECNNLTLQKRCEVPEDVQIVPSVLALRCKCNLTTNKIMSHKARLNLHGKKASLRKLFWDIHTHCDMVCHKTDDHL